MSKYKLPVLQREIDGSLMLKSTLAGKVRPTELVSCTKGCSNCCYQPLAISILEGIHIYDYLESENRWTTKLQQALQIHSDRSMAAPELVTLAALPCPLLKDSECTVYSARPFACRTLVAYGDPHFCHPHRLDSRKANLMDRDDLIAEYWAYEEKVLRSKRIQVMHLPLSTAVIVGAKLRREELDLEKVDYWLLKEYKAKG